MIELIQIPWSPYCFVQHRILEFARASFRTVNVSNSDRSLVWRLTKERYYQVPILRDGKTVVFETGDDSQVIAKYLDERFQLGLFPGEWRGVQSILWRYIDGDVEGVGFKLNDAHWKKFVPKADQAGFIRHKERKFGRGCLDQWKLQQKELLVQMEQRLLPFEQMLAHHAFLLGDRPFFVDFDLYGILRNFLYSGSYEIPACHGQLRLWYRRMRTIKAPK